MDIWFTRIVTVLFREVPDLAAVQAVFAGSRMEAPKSSPDTEMGGAMQGEGFEVEWNAETGERAEVDLVPWPFPDQLEDTSDPEDVKKKGGLAAYGMGAFGQAAGNTFVQARQWALRHNPDVMEQAAAHGGFCRLRMYHGAALRQSERKSTVMEEMEWLLSAAQRLAALPGALLVFLPESEALLTPDELKGELMDASAAGRPPFHALVTVRVFHNGDWAMAATAGMERLGLPDLEYAGLKGQVTGEVIEVLSNMAIYLMKKGDVIRSGHTVDGARGQKWRAQRCGNGVHPASETLRFSEDGAPVPPDPFTPVPLAEDSGPGAPAAPGGPGAGSSPPPDGEGDPSASMANALREMMDRWAAAEPSFRSQAARFCQTGAFSAVYAIISGDTSLRSMDSSMQGAMLVPGFPVIGNYDARLKLMLSLVVTTFDPDPEARCMAVLLAGMMTELYQAEKATSHEAVVLQQIVNDDRYVPMKRVLIPKEITNGYEIYVLNCLLYKMEPDPHFPGISALLTKPGSGKHPAIHVPPSVLGGGMPPSLGLGEENLPPRAPGAPPVPLEAPRSSFSCVRKLLLAIGLSYLGLLLLAGIVRCSRSVFGKSTTSDSSAKPPAVSPEPATPARRSGN